MEVLAVVPARGGSKGIPLKNLVPVAGRPLLAWTLEAALGAGLAASTVVSTDHPEIASLARQMGVEVLHRPRDLASDDMPTLPVLIHALESVRARGFFPDLLVTLQPTSPLRESRHLVEALDLFKSNPEADSLVSVQKIPHQFGPESLMTLDGLWTSPLAQNPETQRQKKKNYWARNGAAIYITRCDNIGSFIWGGRTLAYEMNKIDSIDIDDWEDLRIADALLRSRQQVVK